MTRAVTTCREIPGSSAIIVLWFDPVVINMTPKTIQEAKNFRKGQNLDPPRDRKDSAGRGFGGLEAAPKAM